MNIFDLMLKKNSIFLKSCFFSYLAQHNFLLVCVPVELQLQHVCLPEEK